MIKLIGVKKQFRLPGEGKLPILSVPEWEVEEGEQLALIGPSGSGKSTLLHLLCGVLAPDEGQIIVDDVSLHAQSQAQRDRFRSEKVGIIFQDFHLMSSLTARQNAELALPVKMPKSRKRELTAEWFERVGLADRMNHLPGQLSRGQQQRVAMIRALIRSPKIVLADEPTGSLDRETAEDVMRLLLELTASANATLLVVTHDLELAAGFRTRTDIGELNEWYTPKGTIRTAGGPGRDPILQGNMVVEPSGTSGWKGEKLG
ncbi:ABC transporter ATP-binding protein [Paenibacillus chitinolyticus]|uniref:ABC transporter ATP-binding protein n=1 Tax=Paenibacillus chitinolyticus TaxID=79263 RepID=UPI0036D90999